MYHAINDFTLTFAYSCITTDLMFEIGQTFMIQIEGQGNKRPWMKGFR